MTSNVSTLEGVWAYQMDKGRLAYQNCSGPIHSKKGKGNSGVRFLPPFDAFAGKYENPMGREANRVMGALVRYLFCALGYSDSDDSLPFHGDSSSFRDLKGVCEIIWNAREDNSEIDWEFYAEIAQAEDEYVREWEEKNAQ